MEDITMSESGVDLEFDKFLSEDDQMNFGDFYELRSQPVEFASTKPEVKNVPVTTRTNLRQQLMRQRDFVQQQQKQETSLSNSVTPTTHPSSAVRIATSVSSELPAQVLKVRPLLDNPTKHHVQQTQKRQVQEFLSTQMGKPNNSTNILTQSLPNVIAAANNSLNMVSPLYMPTSGCSLPVEPDSPLSVALSSTATSVEDIDLIGDIISCESFDASMDQDLHLIEPSLSQVSQTMPQSTAFLDHGYDVGSSPSHGNDKSSSSCPPEITSKHHGGRQRQGTPPTYLTSEETRQWYRERQKKDSHNVIEKRRRLNINDKIKELGDILPRSAHDGGLYSDMRQNKGTILKASVDYIHKLKRDQERLKHMEEKQKQMEMMNRKMLLKMQEMEMLMQAHGISSPTSTSASSSQHLMSAVLKQSNDGLPGVLKHEPQPGAQSELLDEFSSPVQGDPMMSLSPPVIPTNCKTVSVEEISDMLS